MDSLSPVLQQELAWLAGELGAARDADVLGEVTLLKVIEACPQETGLLPLRQFVSTIAGEKRQHAADAVASVGYSRLMLSLVSWLQAGRWHERRRLPLAGARRAQLSRAQLSPAHPPLRRKSRRV
jgi:triphosphatase